MKNNHIIISDFYQGQWNVFCRKDCEELLNKFAFTATLIIKRNILFKHKIGNCMAVRIQTFFYVTAKSAVLLPGTSSQVSFFI
jgi:hypothetical protein